MGTRSGSHSGLIDPPLVGRDAHLRAFTTRFETGDWGVPVLITGPAGIGKTTLVRAFEEIARRCSWRVLADTPAKGLATRMSGTYFPALHESLTGGVSATFKERGLREQLICLAEGLQTLNEGLLITLDHPGRAAGSHIQELVAAVEEAARRKLPVQLVIAGRGADIRDLLATDTTGFLGSGEQIDLCSLTRSQTEAVLRQTYKTCADPRLKVGDLSDELLARASLATYGYPYMIELVSQCIRRRVMSQKLTDELLASELAQAQEKLGAIVLEPLVGQLSAGDRAFLHAMAEDDTASKMSDIASRLGKNPQYAGVYRNRLVEAQIIRAASYGKVTFVIPHLREYLRKRQPVEDGFNF